MHRLALGIFQVIGRHQLRMRQKQLEQSVNPLHRFAARLDQISAIHKQVARRQLLELRGAGGGFGRKSRNALSASPNRIYIRPARPPPRRFLRSSPETSQLISPRTISCMRTRSGAPGNCISAASSSSRNLSTDSPRFFHPDQARAVAVIQIGCVVGDLIAQIDQLRFERRTQTRADIHPAQEIRRAQNRANVSRFPRAPQRSDSAREIARRDSRTIPRCAARDRL